MVINGNETGDFQVKNGGRWGTRTLDLCRVKAALQPAELTALLGMKLNITVFFNIATKNYHFQQILCKILYRIPRKTYDSAIFDSLDSFYYHKKTNFLVYRFAISQVCSIVLSSKHSANVAQSVEQLTRNEQVIGSIPIIGSIFLPSSEIYSDINLPMSVKIYYCIRLNLNY